MSSLGALVVLYPGEPVVWDGPVYKLPGNNLFASNEMDLGKIGNPNTLILLNQGSNYALTYQIDKFNQTVGDSVSFIEKRCSPNSIESSLQKINKAYYKLTYTVLNNYKELVEISC